MLLFDVQGDGLCAVMELEVENWSRLSELRKKKGVSFRGAEFKDLKFDIMPDPADVKFVLRGFSEIID